MGKISKNFTREEFDSKDGAIMPLEVLENIKLLVAQLQIIRDYTNLPIKINSGYRSPEHNASSSVNGSKKSQHLLGKAADIVIGDMKPSETYALLEYLNDNDIIKIGGLGSYNTFTHVDIRENKARW